MLKVSLDVVSFGASARVVYTPFMKDLFTRKDRFGVPYQVHRPIPGTPYAEIPRGMVTRESAKKLDTVVHPCVQSVAAVPPRNQEQAECIQKCLDLLISGKDHIFEAPTGFGKSYVGGSVACQLGQTTLIVVTKSDLMDAWKETLIKQLGVPPTEIGIARQAKLKYQGCRFVIAMVHSLAKREYEPEFYRHFGLVLFDEVHRLGAEFFEQVCFQFPAAHRLGLSATPKRTDGKMELVISHIGPVMVRGTWVPMTPKVIAFKTKWKLPYEKGRDDNGQWGFQPMRVVPGRMANVSKAMGENKLRNSMIVSMTVQAYRAHRNVLILSDLIDGHLKNLHYLLLQAGVPPGDMAYYVSGMTKAEYERAKLSRVILGTYGMVKEGTDAPDWDTLIFGTPQANIKQAIGRVIRFKEDKSQPVIFDLIDEHPVLRGFYGQRLRQYYEVGAQIVEMQA